MHKEISWQTLLTLGVIAEILRFIISDSIISGAFGLLGVLCIAFTITTAHKKHRK